MFSKKYFTKFLSALLSATIVTAILPLDGIKVFAVDGNDRGYEIDDNTYDNLVKNKLASWEV